MTSAVPITQDAFERLLARLEGVQRRGEHQAKAMCPAHPNHRTQALSVTYKPEQRRVVVNCLSDKASCTESEIMQAVGLSPADVYDLPLAECEVCHKTTIPDASGRYVHDYCRSGQPVRRKRSTLAAGAEKTPAPAKTSLPARLTSGMKKHGKPVDICRYEYTDAEGTVIHAQLRQHQSVTITRRGVSTDTIAKVFVYQRPDGHGGWINRLGDVQPQLYNLPDVRQAIAASRRIFVLEGEKDCDRLAQLGEVATTNPGGATNLRAAHAAILAESTGEVWAVLDRDVAGYSRGVKLTSQLRNAPLRLFLPRTITPHSDLSDHLDAGHTLTDLIPVTVPELQRLVAVEQAEARSEDIMDAAAEAEARATRATVAASPKAQKADQEAAARWALEAALQLRQLCQLIDDASHLAEPFEADQVERVSQALQVAQQAARAAHEVAHVEISDDLGGLLERDGTSPLAETSDEDDLDHEDVSGSADELADELAERRRQRTGEQGQPDLPPPDIELPMTRGLWRLELGGPGRRDRGVYEFRQHNWYFRAPIPYIHDRVISKDGNDNPLGHWYIVSGTTDGPRVLIGHDELARHSWPNLLDLPVSLDDRILKAASTAIVFAAHRETTVREATPRADKLGHILPPPPDTLPRGYLECADTTSAEALGAWVELIAMVSRVPKLALVLGQSCIAPWVSSLDLQSHIVAIYGDAAQGKSTALRLAASVWGDPGSKSRDGVLTTWNMSKLAPTAYLGEIGNLPAFFDETGMVANLTAGEWGNRIMSICDGASRGRPAPNGRPGFSKGRSWYGLLFSAGTQRLLAGVGAGGAAGVHRRVIEIEAPFTADRVHAKSIESRLRTGYGHLGAELLRRHNTATARGYLEIATDWLCDEIQRHTSPIARELVDLIVAHVAGAAMADDLCGTGDTLQAAAAMAALQLLQEWQQPPHDADLNLDALLTSIATEPAAWPTRAALIENLQPWRPGESTGAIPRAGVGPKAKGFRDDDDEWIAVSTETWDAICAATGADSTIACRELRRRGVLLRQARSDSYQSQIKINGVNARWYKLALPDLPPSVTEPPHGHSSPSTPSSPEPTTTLPAGDPQQSSADTPSTAFQPRVTGPTEAPVTGAATEVTGEVTGLNQPLTRPVTGVTGVTGTPSHTPAREAAPTHARSASVPSRGPARFSAPAAVLDGAEIELVGGREAVASEIRHLGDVARLTRTYRLGWGGGEDRLPDEGQVWLTTATLQHLGLPAVIDVPVDDFQARDDWRAQVRKAFEAIAQLPAVTAAIEDGWQITHLDAWTRLWHPEHRGGAWIVVPGWFRVQGVSLLSTDPDDDPQALLGEDLASPTVLVRRLHEFARQLGVSYRITPAATGLDLIDWTRPPRKDADDSKGSGRRRVAVIRDESELPDFLASETDRRRFRSLEQDFSWWRPWSTLTTSELNCRYAVAYDRGRSYLAPWSSLRLGVEGLTHTTEAHWDGSEKPGYWLLDPDWAKDWPWWLPDLMKASGAPVEDGHWVTTPTLRQLQAVGITPTIRESWTWQSEARYLEPAAKALSHALTASSDPAVVQTLKKVFSATVGKLGQVERPRGRGAHLHRPDWRHHIIAQSRLAIQLTVMKAQQLTGAVPLVVDRDTIVYASNHDDPTQAWPGDPAKLGTGIGQWKPVGIAPLAEWGPQYLPSDRLHHRWNYDGVLTMGPWG